MQTSLMQLSASQRERLRKIIGIIVGSAFPEKIILYGVSGRGEEGMSRGGDGMIGSWREKRDGWRLDERMGVGRGIGGVKVDKPGGEDDRARSDGKRVEEMGDERNKQYRMVEDRRIRNERVKGEGIMIEKDDGIRNERVKEEGIMIEREGGMRNEGVKEEGIMMEKEGGKRNERVKGDGMRDGREKENEGRDEGKKEVRMGLGQGFDLLVVTRVGERRPDPELQDLLEHRCRAIGEVNILIHDIGHVNGKLREGHYFFSLLNAEGILVYDAGRVPLVRPGIIDWVGIRETAQADFAKWDLRAQAFYKSALMNVEDGLYRMAAFMLHQAAEQMYQALLLAYMGYKPCTHNLDKLRRLTNRLSIELEMLFARDTEEEDRLFRLLLTAYVEARYKDEYRIEEGEIRELADRVWKLMSIAARICRNRFRSLEKREFMIKG